MCSLIVKNYLTKSNSDSTVFHVSTTHGHPHSYRHTYIVNENISVYIDINLHNWKKVMIKYVSNN